MQEATDIQLMLRIKEHRDAGAMEALYHRYKHRLMKFFYHMVWDHTHSEDLLQEVFVKLWRNADQYRASGTFSTYLFQIAKNHWLNEKDKLDRRPRLESLAEKKTTQGNQAGR